MQSEEDHRCNQHLVVSSDKRYHQETARRIYGEDVAIIEQQVEDSPKEQQDHTPNEAHSKILALLRLVVVLDEETQAKEHREDCVHLTRKHKEDAIPDGLVECTHKLARRLGEFIEIKFDSDFVEEKFKDEEEKENTDDETEE